MKFLIDAQLPTALARFLSGNGHEAIHVLDVKLSEESDSVIWDYALISSAVIVTKDEDFAVRVALNANGPTIVWLRIGNCRKKTLLNWFAKLLPKIIDSVDRGEKLIEVI